MVAEVFRQRRREVIANFLEGQIVGGLVQCGAEVQSTVAFPAAMQNAVSSKASTMSEAGNDCERQPFEPTEVPFDVIASPLPPPNACYLQLGNCQSPEHLWNQYRFHRHDEAVAQRGISKTAAGI